MVIVDGEGKIVLANAQTESLFGYTPQELTGRGVDTLMPARYHERHSAHRDGFFGDPRARPMGTGLDLWAIRKDGTELPVEISISPIETEQGVLAAAEIRDVTGTQAIRAGTSGDQHAACRRQSGQGPVPRQHEPTS